MISHDAGDFEAFSIHYTSIANAWYKYSFTYQAGYRLFRIPCKPRLFNSVCSTRRTVTSNMRLPKSLTIINQQINSISHGKRSLLLRKTFPTMNLSPSPRKGNKNGGRELTSKVEPLLISYHNSCRQFDSARIVPLDGSIPFSPEISIQI